MYPCKRYSVDIVRIIENARQKCPGCGAILRIASTTPTIANVDHNAGLINIDRLTNRLQWKEGLASGEPQIYVSSSIKDNSDNKCSTNTTSTCDSNKVKNKFIRQSDWIGRIRTIREQERVTKRMESPMGMANEILQKLRVTKPDTDLKEHHPLIDLATKKQQSGDLASDKVFLVEGDFERLADQLEATSKHEEKLIEKVTPLICQRCHDLKFDGVIEEQHSCNSTKEQSASKVSPKPMTGLLLNETDQKLIKTHLKPLSIIVMIIDLFDISFSIPSEGLKMLSDLSSLTSFADLPGIIIVGSKVDLLPRHIKPLAKEYLKSVVLEKISGKWRNKVLSCHLVSAKEDEGIDELAIDLVQQAKLRNANVFLLGKTNVGKSRLFNRLLERDLATVSATAGTTIGTIVNKLSCINISNSRRKLKNNLPITNLLFDLPGVIDAEPSLASFLTVEELKAVKVLDKGTTPCKRMLGSGESLLIAGMIRIDCISTDSDNLRFEVMLKLYMKSIGISTFRLKTTDVSTFTNDCLGRKRSNPPHLMPPTLTGKDDPRWDLFANLQEAASLKVSGTSDPMEIALSDGLGWISIHLPRNCKSLFALNVYTPKGMGVKIRPSIV